MKQPVIVACAPVAATRPLPAEDRASGTAGNVNRFSRQAPISRSVRG
jgi:hypothetical protein